MDERFKKLTIELSNDLYNASKKFLLDNIKGGDATKDAIGLMLSSHISSLVSLMTLISKISKTDENFSKGIDNFIKDLLRFIKNAHPNNNIEFYKNYGMDY